MVHDEPKEDVIKVHDFRIGSKEMWTLMSFRALEKQFQAPGLQKNDKKSPWLDQLCIRNVDFNIVQDAWTNSRKEKYLDWEVDETWSRTEEESLSNHLTCACGSELIVVSLDFFAFLSSNFELFSNAYFGSFGIFKLCHDRSWPRWGLVGRQLASISDQSDVAVQPQVHWVKYSI